MQRNKIKRLLFLFSCFVFLLFGINSNKIKAASDFVIQNYDIKIDVGEDNVLDIKETIHVYFYKQRHGIYRTIPTLNEVRREDGTIEQRPAIVTNIKVNNKYTKNTYDDSIKLVIGNENTYVYGNVTYVISYKYNLGPDTLENKDEFYFNAIGSYWTTKIKNATIEINMPKTFDNDKLMIVHGKYGEDSTEKISYSIIGNQIKISATNLDSGEAITIKSELPEGYFTNTSYLNENFFDVFVGIILPILLLTVVVVLWYRKGRDEKPIEPVSFYPPKGYNSFQVGYLYKGKPMRKHVISLIVELASMGYVSIEELDRNNKETNPDNSKYIITKLKEYDGHDSDLKAVASSLHIGKDKTTEKELNERFYSTIDDLVYKMYSKDKTKKFQIYEDFKTKGILLGLIFTLLIIISSLLLPTIKTQLWECLYVPIFVVSFLSIFNVIAFNKKDKQPLFVKLVILFFDIAFSFAICITVSRLFIYSTLIEFSLTMALVCAIVSLIFTIHMPKRTEENKKIYGQILGFKNFLKIAEKEKLEALILEDPEYFYKTIPFAYVLGVSKKWIEKFKGLDKIVNDINSTVYVTGPIIRSSITKSYHSHTTFSKGISFGGGSSGGGSGCSGGGSGGGGGGSW